MAKSRNRKKKAQHVPKITPKGYVKKRGRQIPVKEAYVSSNWKTKGMATVIVVRQMGNEYLLVGSYVVDVFCLGVKDTYFWYKVSEEDFEDKIMAVFTNQMGLDLEKCDPQFAFNLVYGAVEYAEDLGFDPHPDFKITELILPPVEDIEFIDIEFGKNGKPLYVPGPHDNSGEIIKQLRKIGYYDKTEDKEKDFDTYEEVE